MFTTAYSCMFTFVYPCLLVFTYVYMCLPFFNPYILVFTTYVYMCFMERQILQNHGDARSALPFDLMIDIIMTWY